MQTRSYSQLDSAPIRATIARLARRIDERFPGSGLSGVAVELEWVSEENERIVEHLRRPIWWLRVLITVAIVGSIAFVGWAAQKLTSLTAAEVAGPSELLQGMDAAINEVILLGLALLFLVSLEGRLKRRAALRILHRLRSIAHVVDMHQLTKDPEFALHPMPPTRSSPARTLPRDQLARYLDYCSELLALTSKLAALHGQHLQDPVVLSAVNDLESLTAGLSRKIWQKISILNTTASQAGTPAPPDP